jgi:hypothetical protein
MLALFCLPGVDDWGLKDGHEWTHWHHQVSEDVGAHF